MAKTTMARNGKRARTASKRKAATRVRKAPKQKDLPGLEDRAIKPLEDAAEAYAEIRDERIDLNKQEVALKTRLLKLMHDHGKTVYHRGGVTIQIVAEEETVKVRIRKADEAGAAESASELADDEPAAETPADEEAVG